jgi:hypothetical protein
MITPPGVLSIYFLSLPREAPPKQIWEFLLYIPARSFVRLVKEDGIALAGNGIQYGYWNLSKKKNTAYDGS